eukprot:COSAG06_NODE_69015_length_199_cov_38.790000_1_plen_45_part_01
MHRRKLRSQSQSQSQSQSLLLSSHRWPPPKHPLLAHSRSARSYGS